MYRNPNVEAVEINEEQKVIINLMNGCADILENDIVAAFETNCFESIPKSVLDKLLEREYFYENEPQYIKSESKLTKQLIENSKLEPPNFVYIPTFECNLNCYYCFEKAYEKVGNAICGKSADAFIAFCNFKIKELERKNNIQFDNSDISITITGGEPLLLSKYEEIEKILMWANKNEYKVGIVTNGTTLKEYLSLFEKYPLERMQITLDGSKYVHDQIRVGHNGEPTFDIIVKNIELIGNFVNNLSVRININKTNIESIRDLESTIKKYPSVEFYTYLMQQEGCNGTANIIDEVEGLKILLDVKEKMADVKNLIIVYHGKKLIEAIFDGQPFKPIIKICAAMQNQYIVDYKGQVYKCWWGMGNENYSIGYIDEAGQLVQNGKEELYRKRNINNMPKCIMCKYRYICGGGCTGRLTQNQLVNNGVICPDLKNVISYMVKRKLVM